MLATSAEAPAAPNGTAAIKASSTVDSRLMIARITPMAAAASRMVARVGPPFWRCSQAQPATPPTPNRATMAPNWAVLACSTSRTNTTPSENSAPTPITAVMVAGSTARTIGRRNAATTREQAGAGQVAGQHDAAPVPALGDAGGDRPGEPGGQQPQHQDQPDRRGRAGEVEHQRHQRHRAHPVAERGDRLADDQVAVAPAAQDRGARHQRSSLSSSSRVRYTRPGRRPTTGALPSSRLTTIGASTAAPNSAPRRPLARASTGIRAACASSEPGAACPTIFPPAIPASSTSEPGQAATPSAPIAGDSPRPPAPRRKGDQLCPATQSPAASAAATGWSRPAIRGPTAPLPTSRTPAAAS